MVTFLLILLVLIGFSLLTAVQQRNLISGVIGGIVDTTGFLIKATFWIGGLFVAPFFALVALSADDRTLGFIFGVVGFIWWAMLIDKLKEKKETKK